jgi:multidrug resistance efflux pump
MPENPDFVDRIVEGFQSLRQRPAFAVIEGQFESGELTFIVDRDGIRIHLSPIELDEPEFDPVEDLELGD